MAENKTKETDSSVDAFLDTIKDEKKRSDCYKIAKLMTQVSKAKPKMWGSAIVGFGSYHYKYESGREGDSSIIAFSPRKQNITVYLMAGLFEDKVLMKKLGKFKTGGGCLYINSLDDVDTKVLKTLMEKTVQALKARYGFDKINK